jgi:hypothetical protein
MGDKVFTKTAEELGRTPGMSLTLFPRDVGTHDSGWTITGEVHYAEYPVCVFEFEAVHPELGRVWGDFDEAVHADSQEALEHFVKHHPPVEWDFNDS